MPFINIKVTEGVTREQKQRVIEEVTKSVANILDKNPFWIHVVIEEVPADNWGTRGQTVTQLRDAGGPEDGDD